MVIHSKPYVLLGPTFSGKTSLLILLTCIFAKLEERKKTPVLVASFPRGLYRSARDACLYAEPTRTIHGDYVHLHPNIGEVTWLAPSGHPETGVAREDFVRALEENPGVLGFVFDLGIGFELRERDPAIHEPVEVVVRFNVHFYKKLLRIISEEGIRLFPALKHAKKVFFLNKIDVLIHNNFNVNDALSIFKDILKKLRSASKELLNFDIFEGVKYGRESITYALKTDRLDDNLIEFRQNALRNLINPVRSRLSSEAEAFLVGYIKSLALKKEPSIAVFKC
ncbi:MAG: hypothetical protein ACTSVA_07795 [Candidatus Njordarchaeales archaeon]